MTTRSMDGAAIKAMRNALKESQAAFAARFGVDQSTVSLWETHGPPDRGTTRYALEQLQKELTAGQEA